MNEEKLEARRIVVIDKINQIKQELDQIDSQLRKKNFKENIEREIKSI